MTNRLTRQTIFNVIGIAILLSVGLYLLSLSRVEAQPQAAPIAQLSPTFSHELDCARASWYNAPIGDGKRMFVPSYSGGYDASVQAWDDMTDPERGAFLAQCGEVQP
jgi:hypothetical protein